MKDNQPFKEMGFIIKSVRRYYGLSSKQLASQLGVSPSTVCLWERGRRIPNLIQFRKLMGSFPESNVTTFYLLLAWLRELEGFKPQSFQDFRDCWVHVENEVKKFWDEMHTKQPQLKPPSKSPYKTYRGNMSLTREQKVNSPIKTLELNENK